MKATKGKLKKGKVSATSTTGTSSPPPSMLPTTAYSLFQSSIRRARNLLEIHRMAHGAQARPPAFLADAHRAAVVLAVSALDAFVRTFVIDQIVSKVANPSDTIPEKLREQIKDCLGDDSILEAARQGDLSSRVGKAFRDRFDDQSFQGVKKIAEAMRLLGYDDVFATIARAASVNEDNLKGDLGRFTKRRHIISHCGDYDLSQTPPEENKILRKDVLECVKTVELVAREINKLR
jgi:hypothetical protein